MPIKFRDSLIESAVAEKRSFRLTVIVAAVTLVLLGALFYARACVFILIDVSGPSMMNTLQNGDMVVANRKTEPQRGDIIVFYSDGDDKVLIKRIIGVPGDTVYSVDGRVYIAQYNPQTGSADSIALEEDYVMTQGITTFSPVYVDEGEFFVLGDNRGNSNDSRNFGTINGSDIIGVVTQWSLRYKDTFWAYFYRLL